MRRPKPLPETLALAPFEFADAVREGVPRSRLRQGDISHPHRGVYVPGAEEEDVVARCRSLAPLLGDHQWFSHLTAARLWFFPLPWHWTPDEPLHVLSLGDTAPMRRPDVVGWETEDANIPRTGWEGLPVIRPADAWCQLAVPGAAGVDDDGRRRSVGLDWLIAVGDYLLTGPKVDGRRHPLCTRDELRAALRRRRGRRGVKVLRQALEEMRCPVHSPQETFLRLAMVAHGLPEPEVQVPVLTREGLRHADLGYRKARLLFEYQGDHHRTDRRQWLQDLTRVQLFEDAGYRTILIGADDLKAGGVSALIARIRRALS